MWRSFHYRNQRGTPSNFWNKMNWSYLEIFATSPLLWMTLSVLQYKNPEWSKRSQKYATTNSMQPLGQSTTSFSYHHLMTFVRDSIPRTSVISVQPYKGCFESKMLMAWRNGWYQEVIKKVKAKPKPNNTETWSQMMTKLKTIFWPVSNGIIFLFQSLNTKY